jgi:hypothetical protein
MFAQRVTVEFVDGTSKEVMLTQWSIGQFAHYAQAKGWHVDHSAPGLLAVTMLRYQAYAELHRDPTAARPVFDKWDFTVNSVDPVQKDDDGDVDPTQTAPSDG